MVSVVDRFEAGQNTSAAIECIVEVGARMVNSRGSIGRCRAG